MKTWTNPTVEELEVKETAWFAVSSHREYCPFCNIWGTPSCGGNHGTGDDTSGDQEVTDPDEGYGES